MNDWIRYLTSNKRDNSIFAIIWAVVWIMMCIWILYHTSIWWWEPLSTFWYIVIIWMCLIAIWWWIYKQSKTLYRHYIEYKIKYIPWILIDQTMWTVTKVKSLWYSKYRRSWDLTRYQWIGEIWYVVSWTFTVNNMKYPFHSEIFYNNNIPNIIHIWDEVLIRYITNKPQEYSIDLSLYFSQ